MALSSKEAVAERSPSQGLLDEDPVFGDEQENAVG